MPGTGERGLHAGDVDDLAFAPADHVPRDSLPDMEDTRDIRLEERFKAVRREILERGAMLHARIVDQDVDRSGTAFKLVNGCSDRIVVRRIKSEGPDFAAQHP